MMQNLINKARTFKSYPTYLGRSIFPDTVQGVRTYNKLCKIVNWSEHKARKKLLDIFKDKKTHMITDNDGFLVSDMLSNPKVEKAIDYALKLAGDLNLRDKMQDSKKSFLLNHALDVHDPAHKPLLDLATDEEFLAPIVNYLGDIPVLASIAIWYSPNDGDTIQRSQLFHLDGEDSKQLKCFLPLREVTNEHGPLTFIDAEKSTHIYETLKRKGKISKRNEKLDDDALYSLISKDDPICAVGKPGTVAMVDTSRCYHFGSRPAKNPRLQLHIQYYTAHSMNMPICGRVSDKRYNNENVSPLFKSVIGLGHLDFALVRRRKSQ